MSKSIRKTIDVDVNETVSADVTLSFYEIKEFFNACSNEEKQELCNELGIRTYRTNIGDSLIDVLKMELLMESAKKYTLEELESKLNQ